MLATFREILAQDAGDGVEFDADALRVDCIREELEYGGQRLRTTASISGARINLTIDIGFGHALEPGAELIDYPTTAGVCAGDCHRREIPGDGGAGACEQPDEGLL